MTPRTAADTLVPRFKARIEALSVRIQSLTSLRRVVGLPPPADLSESRWVLLNAPLVNLERRLSARLDDAANRYLSRANSHPHAQRFNSLLGQLELKLSKTFDLFDTYVDVLTQRHSPELGPLLRGCDALAAAALLRDHPH